MTLDIHLNSYSLIILVMLFVTFRNCVFIKTISFFGGEGGCMFIYTTWYIFFKAGLTNLLPEKLGKVLSVACKILSIADSP